VGTHSAGPHVPGPENPNPAGPHVPGPENPNPAGPHVPGPENPNPAGPHVPGPENAVNDTRTILITGATAGLGGALASRLWQLSLELTGAPDVAGA
jgi:hypothetical protein